MSSKVLIVFAHPLFERSKTHKVLISYLKKVTRVTIHDLYQEYPEYFIKVEKEKELLSAHDIIIWQHPIYWYSCPPLLKQWIDQVLEVGWAYGKGGTALQGKKLMQIVSTGGSEHVYGPEGNNRYPLRTFLTPFEQTARLCGMDYVAPFVVHGTHRLTAEELEEYGRKCFFVVDKLANDPQFANQLLNKRYANDWLQNDNK
jgi:glutathione-regulated potassium-efflux system ancillary protein KefG